MAPILIDSRDLLKLAVVSVLSIVFAFSGGYLFGFKQAGLDASYQSDDKYSSDGKSLVESNGQAPVVAELDTNESIKLSQNKTIEKVESAVGQVTAESTITESTTAEPTMAESAVTESISTVPSVIEPLLTVPLSTALETVSTNDTAKKNNIEKESEVTFNPEVDGSHKSNVSDINDNVGSDNASTSSTTNGSSNNTSENNAKFTIQVAVYGDLKNAESMMLSLQEKTLDSYVSSYTTKSGKRRFNVRFGYFQKKKMALNALDNYIDNHRGDGYLVNFSAKNIVSFVKESVVQPKFGNSALDNSTFSNPTK